MISLLFNAEGSTYRNNLGAIDEEIFMMMYSKKYFNKKSYFINGSVTISSEVPRMPTMIKKCCIAIDGLWYKRTIFISRIKKLYKIRQ